MENTNGKTNGMTGALAVVETLVAAGSGSPLHRHPSLDETFYVLQGRLTFRVGDAYFTALPGASVFAPRGIPHAYSNETDEAVRVLLVCRPEDERSGGRATQTHRSDIVALTMI